MIRIAVAGALGRTGRRVLELAMQDERFDVTAALTLPNSSDRGTLVRVNSKEVIITDELTNRCDVLIDFTSAKGTMIWLDACLNQKIPMVIGTTGHDEQALSRIKEAARLIPILKAANFSVGVQIIARLAAQLAKELDSDYDIEVIETHHRNKLDAPSGTALMIADEMLAAKGQTREQALVFGRKGETGVRPRGQIGVHAVRMGDHIGQHEVHFSGPGETITIRHTAHSRDTFAAGALRAAAWIIDKKPGLYGMRDIM